MECFNTACRDFKKEKSLCSKCKRAYYCSRECQKAHYKTHKKVCVHFSIQVFESKFGTTPDPNEDLFLLKSVEIRPTTFNEGLFACENIQRGEAILYERPLLELLFPLNEDIKKQTLRLVVEYQKLNLKRKESYDRLWDNYLNDDAYMSLGSIKIIKEKDRIYGKFKTNYFITQKDGQNLGRVHAFLSKFNHSCAPNACYLWNNSKQMACIVALKNITAGEEIYISYGPWIRADVKKRHEASFKIFKFYCACSVCSAKNLKVEENRAKIHEILTEAHESLNTDFRKIDQALELCENDILDDVFFYHLWEIKMRLIEAQYVRTQDSRLQEELKKTIKKLEVCRSIYANY